MPVMKSKYYSCSVTPPPRFSPGGGEAGSKSDIGVFEHRGLPSEGERDVAIELPF